ncbi:MAG: polysaccharide deacetylase family protein [Synergistaceae bacterium]|jgi:peptidoglycan/xylan/chitin deacetylase (PgdA/CDA1 family)|nr:polysaccharide deacetylase family protein [Synergistaceae bacterium]
MRACLTALIALFLCIERGPLEDERARWRIASGNPFVKEVVLTFDDGPRDRGMPELLAALREADVKATFFLVGKFAERYADITKSIADEGHDVENHTYTHDRLSPLWLEKIMRQAERCNEVIDSLGIPTPRFMRPPGGGFTFTVFRAMRRMNMVIALWSVNSADYTGKSADEIVRGVLGNVRPGAIILMHSGVPATVEAVPVIARELRARGYSFATLRDMWNEGKI